MVAFNVTMRLALVAETFVAKATAPKPHSTSIHLTHCMIFNVTQHFVLLQIDWKSKLHYQFGFLFMVSIYVSLKATFCFEFNISVAELANIGTGLHMEAFDMSHKILLVIQRLVAYATGPVLQPSRVHH